MKLKEESFIYISGINFIYYSTHIKRNNIVFL